MKRNFALYENGKAVAIANIEGIEKVSQCYREITHKKMVRLEQQGIRQAEISLPEVFPDLEDLA